ncbi:MAG: hypothetical protein IKN63_05105 [Bacilli bacterium]|nr:hypothetical protein [Bacilli bacterium]
MSKISDILSKIGVSKVRLAKYLGVSRQMLYNYLALDKLEEWPSEKATRLLQLLEVKRESDLDNLEIDGEYIIKIDNKLNEGVKVQLSGNNLIDLKGFNRKEIEILTDIISLLKDRLRDDRNKEIYNSYVYLYHYLQSMENNKELKYLLCYVSKLMGFTEPNEFLFNQEQQFNFEAIIFSAFMLYNKGGASRSKLADTHKRFVQEINRKHEEKLSRTQELTAVKEQALKELGYATLTEENGKEVLEKIAEIQSRGA